MNNNDIQHHGIKGMRWGVRRTPTQLGHRPTAMKKKLLGGVTKKKQSESDKPKELSAEEKKEKILKSRSAKELFDNAHLFNDKELNEAYNRLNLEKNIKNLIETAPSRAERFVDTVTKWGGKISDLAKNVDNAYTNVTKLGKHLGLIDDADGSNDSSSSTNAGSKKTTNKKKSGESDTDKKKTDDSKKADDSKDTKSTETKSSETKKSKPDNNDNARTGGIFGSSKNNTSNDSNSGSRSSKTDDEFWSMVYPDLTPTSRSRNVAVTNGSTTVSGLLGSSSLPALENRVAGYLAPPKDDN